MDVTDKIISALLKDVKKINMITLAKEREIHSTIPEAKQHIKTLNNTKKKSILQRAYNHTAKTLKTLKKLRNKGRQIHKKPFTQ